MFGNTVNTEEDVATMSEDIENLTGAEEASPPEETGDMPDALDEEEHVGVVAFEELGDE